jgi:hypothetical protein
MGRNIDDSNKLRTFEALGFVQKGVAGSEVFGDCVFCGKPDKLYINAATGLWSCKAGHCALEGNLFTFITLWYEALLDTQDDDQWSKRWYDLATERGLPEDDLKAAGIVLDEAGRRWVVPVRNNRGNIANLRFYAVAEPRQGTRKLRGLPGIEAGLFGAEQLSEQSRRKHPVIIVEGEWDAIALRHLLGKARPSFLATVVAVPGASIFKPQWVEWLAGREFILIYDNDVDGLKGIRRAYRALSATSPKPILTMRWPSILPEQFDIRDYLIHRDGTWDEMSEWLEPYADQLSDEDGDGQSIPDDMPLPSLAEGTRPNLDTVVSVYARHLHMTPDLRDALRIVYAVVMSNDLGGEPLWAHIVGPPGSGKTELLMSCSSVRRCVTRSTLTPHSLVSGFLLSGGRDPSLLPKLFGRTFVLKDFTEILRMPKITKDEVYSILRGAYDGRVEKQFGNGLVREYAGYFSMVSGVTHAIFGEQGASLGERFLMFHMNRIDDAVTEQIIMSALDNVGNEIQIKEDLAAAARLFLEYRIPEEMIPTVPRPYLSRILSLAQLVAMLRASVERESMRGERLLYRPRAEVGTRLAKQFKKMLICLALQHNPPEVTEDDYRIVLRIAASSCVGWNMEALIVLSEMDGQTLTEIADAADIPMSTLRDQLDELVMLGVLIKVTPVDGRKGRPSARYFITPQVRRHWIGSGFPLTAPSAAELASGGTDAPETSNGHRPAATSPVRIRFRNPRVYPRS